MENHSKTVVIVGSGSAGFAAAIVAKEAGLEPIIVESTGKLGGSSAMSGGGAHLPGTGINNRAGDGVRDDRWAARGQE